MRLVILFLFIGLICCRKDPVLSIHHTNQNKLIALQPLNEYSGAELSSLQRELSNFFNAQVIVLPSLQIPVSYRSSTTTEGYSYLADSLIQFLLNRKQDRVDEIIGLTHDEMLIVKNTGLLAPDKTTTLSFFQRVKGLGYISEPACVISDYSFISTDTAITNKRLRKVVLHEVGHNLGLDNCKTDACLMSEKNGDNAILDNGNGDYCERCKRKLN